jgi:nucleotide-binding universal stress UspA family protein
MSAKPIVAATDGSEESLRAVDWAAREAVLRGAPLRIVSGAALLPRMMEREEEGQDLEIVTDALVKERDVALTAAAERATRVSADLLIDTDHLSGAPALAVTESGSGALMLVVGSRGAGAFTALILGSVSRYAATHATCPVVVVRDETAAPHRQIAVGIGDPDTSADSLEFAFEEATLRKAALLAVHAWNIPRSGTERAFASLGAPGGHAMEQKLAHRLKALVEGWQEKYPGVEVSQEVLYGHPGRALAGLSARADLVVIGRHPGQHGLHGPGAVTHAVLNHAHGPIVTVPSA